MSCRFCWLPLLLVTSVMGEEPLPQYSERQDLSYRLDAAGKKHPIESPADWELRRQQVLEGVEAVMGPLPRPAEKVPLQMEVLEEKTVGKILRKKIRFHSDSPKDWVPAWLLIPEHKAGSKIPAILCLQQTTSLGKDEPAGLGGNSDLNYALELAQRGYITLAPDYPSFGEYKYDFAPEHGYLSGSMKAIYDNVRAVDLLQSLPEVDGEKLGVIGHSLGGHNAIFTAMFEPRLKAIVSSCGYCSFTKDDVPSWTGIRYMPLIAQKFGNSSDQVPFDFPELIAGMAPRPCFTSACKKDEDFDYTGVEDCQRAALPIYKLYDAPQNLVAIYPDAGHSFPKAARTAAYEFLDKALRPKAARE